MTIFRAGGEDIDWVLVVGGGKLITTTAGRFDAAYARCAVAPGTATNNAMRMDWGTPVKTIWCTHRMYGVFMDTGSADSDWMKLRAPDGTIMMRVNGNNGDYHTDVIVGGALATVNTWSKQPVNNVRQKITLKMTLDAVDGEMSFWVDDVLSAQFLGDTVGSTGQTELASFDVLSPGNSSEPFISEIVFADEPTHFMRVSTLIPDGDGNEVDWAGGFADVDEVVENQSDFLSSVTPDEVELMTVTAYGGNANYEVKNLFVTVKARTGAVDRLQLEDGLGNLLVEDGHTVGDAVLLESGIPSQLQAAVRHGTTDGFGDSEGLETLHHDHFQAFPINPDTSNPWTTAELDTLEAGVKAIT